MIPLADHYAHKLHSDSKVTQLEQVRNLEEVISEKKLSVMVTNSPKR